MFRTASRGEGTRRVLPGREFYPDGSPTRTGQGYSQLVRPDALNVFGFGTFIAGNDIERHFISFIQGLETLADDGAVVNEDVLA